MVSLLSGVWFSHYNLTSRRPSFACGVVVTSTRHAPHPIAQPAPGSSGHLRTGTKHKTGAGAEGCARATLSDSCHCMAHILCFVLPSRQGSGTKHRPLGRRRTPSGAGLENPRQGSGTSSLRFITSGSCNFVAIWRILVRSVLQNSEQGEQAAIERSVCCCGVRRRLVGAATGGEGGLRGKDGQQRVEQGKHAGGEGAPKLRG